jgi:hypothetical protein
VLLIPPQSELASPGKDGHFAKGLINQPDVVGINDRAFQDAGVHEPGVGIDDPGAFEALKDLVFNDGDTRFPQALSESTQGARI